VSRLGLSTVQEKTEAICNLIFLVIVKQLEYAEGLFGYYRKFVDHYADVSLPLVQLKTRCLKDAPRKGGYERETDKSDNDTEDDTQGQSSQHSDRFSSSGW